MTKTSEESSSGTASSFGGFSLTPETYQIRRLVRTTKPAADLTRRDESEPWEIVIQVEERKNNTYFMTDAPSDDSPIGYFNGADYKDFAEQNATKYIEYVPGTSTYKNIDFNNAILKYQLAKMMTDTKRYLKELPPTTYERVSDRSLFRKPNGDDYVMEKGSTSGYRIIEKELSITNHYASPISAQSNDLFLSNLRMNVAGGAPYWSYRQRIGSSIAGLWGKVTDSSTTTLTDPMIFPNQAYEKEDQITTPAAFTLQAEIMINAGKAGMSFVCVTQGAEHHYALEFQPGIDGAMGIQRLYKDGVFVVEYVAPIKALTPFNVSVTLVDGNRLEIVVNKEYKMKVTLWTQFKFFGKLALTVNGNGEAGFDRVYLTVPETIYKKEEMTVTYDWINYHLAADIYDPVNEELSVRETGMGIDFYAPEDGEFWIYSDYEPYKGIPLIQGNFLKDVQYVNAKDGKKEGGIIGILVTNPDEPRQGRVYLFCHMGSEKANETVLQYKDEYVLRGHERYPQDRDNRIKVKAGDWIGKVGTRGYANGPHIHFEVLEYFKIIRNEKYEEKVNDEADKSVGWKRVNPLTCFDTKTHTIKPGYLYNEKKVIDAFIDGIFEKNRASRFEQTWFQQAEFK